MNPSEFALRISFGLLLGAAPLTLVQTIPLPGVEGRIDHMAVDVKGQRLFMAALGNNTLEVIDLCAGQRIRTLRGLSEPQGVVFAADLNRLFVANGERGACDIFDGTSLDLIRSVKDLDDADNVRYDAATKLLYVGYGKGALRILNANTADVVGDIKLAGHPESFQLEASGSRIFVNIPSAKHIAVIDRNKRAVIATWPLDGFHANFPMALDEGSHRLLVGCRSPAVMVVCDTATGGEVNHISIAGDTDDLFYDAARKRIYTTCGEGAISVLSQKDADHYEPLARIATAPGARTGLFVPATGRFYLAVPHRDAQSAAIRVYDVQP